MLLGSEPYKGIWDDLLELVSGKSSGHGMGDTRSRSHLRVIARGRRKAAAAVKAGYLSSCACQEFSHGASYLCSLKFEGGADAGCGVMAHPTQWWVTINVWKMVALIRTIVGACGLCRVSMRKGYVVELSRCL